MKNLNDSMKTALLFKEHESILYRFAMNEFRKKYPHGSSGSTWFNGYEVIDENTICINYQYGGGDMEMDGSFNVKIDENGN